MDDVTIYNEQGNVHYLPYQPFIQANREITKVRIVFDIVLKSANKRPLDNNLHPGPYYLPKFTKF